MLSSVVGTPLLGLSLGFGKARTLATRPLRGAHPEMFLSSLPQLIGRNLRSELADGNSLWSLCLSNLKIKNKDAILQVVCSLTVSRGLVNPGALSVSAGSLESQRRKFRLGLS